MMALPNRSRSAFVADGRAAERERDESLSATEKGGSCGTERCGPFRVIADVEVEAREAREEGRLGQHLEA